MRRTIFRRVALAALAGPVVGWNTRAPKPFRSSLAAACELPADKVPTIFRDPTVRGYPYNIHETDGLSRNPRQLRAVGLTTSAAAASDCPPR